MPSHVSKVISYGCELHLNFFDNIKAIFPPDGKGRLVSMYGATEGGPIALFDGNDITPSMRQLYKDGHGICLGKTDSSIIEVSIRVPDEAGQYSFVSVLNNSTSQDIQRIAGLKGEVCISGPGASTKCTNAEDTAATKITGASGKIYHRTGDYGYYDREGNLWDMGRIAHAVKTKGGMIYALQVEAAINTLKLREVYATAFVGVPSTGGGDVKIPFVVLRLFPEYTEVSPETLNLMRDLLRASKLLGHVDVQFIIHEAGVKWPVDPRHKSKIGRVEISQWAAAFLARQK